MHALKSEKVGASCGGSFALAAAIFAGSRSALGLLVGAAHQILECRR